MSSALVAASVTIFACGGDDTAPADQGNDGPGGAGSRAGATSAGRSGSSGAANGGGSSASGQAGRGGGGGAVIGGAAGGAGTSGLGGSSTDAGAGGASGGAAAGAAGTVGAAGSSTGGAAGSPAGGAAGIPAGAAGAVGGETAKKPFDWVGVIGTGQSLSIGSQGTPVISTKQPYGNLKLTDTSPDPKFKLDGNAKFETVPLVEPIRPDLPGYTPGEYPSNINGETPHSGMANQLSAFFQTRGLGAYVTAHTVVGWGGQALVCIDKDQSAASECKSTDNTTKAYRGSLAEATAFAALAKAAKKTFGYGAVILTHGETDAGNQKYQAGIIDLQADYEKDLRAITGQTTGIPLLVTQTSTKPGANTSAVQVWKAGIAAPGKVICVGPKYAYEYAPDLLHLPAASYLRLGQKYAEVMDAVVNRGIAWRPLAPDPDAAPSISGAVITVPLHVPNPPLQWDESQPKNHQKAHTEWAKGRGFEVRTSKGDALTIASVAIVGSAVQITLSKAPIAADGVVVGYAITQDFKAPPDGSNNRGGMVDGLRGELRDADDYLGYDTQTIAAKVVKGSKTVKSVANNGFAKRAGRDLVTGKGVPAGTIVQATPDADTITLADAWTGPTGTVDLTLHHDQHNYAVHFSLPVPP